MYEEQELTMQVFSEPEIATNDSDVIVSRKRLAFQKFRMEFKM